LFLSLDEIDRRFPTPIFLFYSTKMPPHYGIPNFHNFLKVNMRTTAFFVILWTRTQEKNQLCKIHLTKVIPKLLTFWLKNEKKHIPSEFLCTQYGKECSCLHVNFHKILEIWATLPFIQLIMPYSTYCVRQIQ
jgi:hypothetical protein